MIAPGRRYEDLVARFSWSVPRGVQLRRAGRRVGDRPQPRRALLGGRAGQTRAAHVLGRRAGVEPGDERARRRSASGAAIRCWSCCRACRRGTSAMVGGAQAGRARDPLHGVAAREGHRLPRRHSGARADRHDRRAGGRGRRRVPASDAAGPDRARRRAGRLARPGTRARARRPRPASPRARAATSPRSASTRRARRRSRRPCCTRTPTPSRTAGPASTGSTSVAPTCTGRRPTPAGRRRPRASCSVRG